MKEIDYETKDAASIQELMVMSEESVLRSSALVDADEALDDIIARIERLAADPLRPRPELWTRSAHMNEIMKRTTCPKASQAFEVHHKGRVVHGYQNNWLDCFYLDDLDKAWQKEGDRIFLAKHREAGTLTPAMQFWAGLLGHS